MQRFGGKEGELSDAFAVIQLVLILSGFGQMNKPLTRNAGSIPVRTNRYSAVWCDSHGQKLCPVFVLSAVLTFTVG